MSSPTPATTTRSCTSVEDESPLRSIEMMGAELVLDPAGALYLVEERALVVADMHLEKGSAYARRGQMLPPYDTRETLNRLAALVERHAPRRIIALGDSLHDRWAEERLPQTERELLSTLQQTRDFIWIAGNHDPAPHGLGGTGLEVLHLGALSLRHEPSPAPARGELCGHLHPVARITVRGRSLRRRCFVSNGVRMVLPAFGAFTGGLDVREPAIASLFPAQDHALHILGEGRTYCLPGGPLPRQKTR